MVFQKTLNTREVWEDWKDTVLFIRHVRDENSNHVLFHLTFSGLREIKVDVSNKSVKDIIIVKTF